MTYDQISALVANESNDIVYVADIKTYELLYINNAARRILGNPPDEKWLYQPCYQVIQNRDMPCPFCTNHLLTHDAFYTWEFYNPVLKKYFSLKDKLLEVDGRLSRLEIAIDITEKEQANQQLAQRLFTEETLLQCIKTLTDSISLDQGITRLLQIICRYYQADRAYIFELCKDGEYMSDTYEWCENGAAPQKGNLQRVPVQAAKEWISQYQEKGGCYIKSVRDTVNKDSAEYKLLMSQNIDCLLTAPLMIDSQVIGFLGVDNPRGNTDVMTFLQSVGHFIVDDINKRKLTEELTRLSYTDSLTGAGNRNKYIQTLNNYEKAPPGSLGVVYLDINGLKRINDTHGHQYGDYVIRHVGCVLQEIFKDGIYRTGGDEFVVLADGLSRSAFEGKVMLLREHSRKDDEFNVSIGVSWSEDHTDPSRQIIYTDELMYVDKQGYYRSQMGEKGSHRSGLSKELLQEIADGRFVVYLQPKIKMNSGKVCGAEALVRRLDDFGNLIPPVKFIPLYEMEGIVSHVDFFVLQTVCETLQKWKNLRLQPESIKIAVNLSRITLMEHNIVNKLVSICQEYGVAPDQIDIEVTESIGTIAAETLAQLMEDLSREGFSISLDDFGSQYSNLAILTEMDFNEVKLDKSLIDHIEQNGRSQIVTACTIDMCKKLNLMSAVAEGIETIGQRDLLAQLQCDVGQGYYFDKPMSIQSFTDKYLINTQSGQEE